jgi:hypothetical protein
MVDEILKPAAKETDRVIQDRTEKVSSALNE